MAVRFFPHRHDVLCADLSPRSPLCNGLSGSGMIGEQSVRQHSHATDDEAVLAHHVAINHACGLVQPVNSWKRNNSTQRHVFPPLSKRDVVGEIPAFLIAYNYVSGAAA